MNANQFFDDLLEADMRRQIGLALNQAKSEFEDSKAKKCGRCLWWMKSSDCPQEKNVKGYSRGPSGSSPIARSCVKFEFSQRAIDATGALKEKVDKISVARRFSDLPEGTHY